MDADGLLLEVVDVGRVCVEDVEDPHAHDGRHYTLLPRGLALFVHGEGVGRAEGVQDRHLGGGGRGGRVQAGGEVPRTDTRGGRGEGGEGSGRVGGAQDGHTRGEGGRGWGRRV